MNVLDLFSGIGGFSLGLERAGMRTVAFCEIDPYARAVLRKHWPDVPCYDDVRELTADRLAGDGIGVDVITAGFPCQDISYAGRGAGIAGERSGLWREVARLVGELRPRYAILENVAALLSRGLGDVLGDLAEVGYDAEWSCIPAAAIGAPHRRDRWWCVAYPNANGRGCEVSGEPKPCGVEGERRGQPDGLREVWELQHTPPTMADASRARGATWISGSQSGQEGDARILDDRRMQDGRTDFWSTEPDVGRVAHGVPARVDRLRCLGNAVVPQIPEIIGRAILEADKQQSRNSATEKRSESSR